jgi:predicted nucleotidyltransferase component of viral defense system
MIPRFEAQVRLLLRVLPEFSDVSVFALKGGTAINLFVQDLPRLSVDLDFAYMGLEPTPHKPFICHFERSERVFNRG